MTTLSPRQIAEYAHDAGFRGQDLTTAVAIALAESGGRPSVHNDVPPDDSYGLWQINMLGALGPERRRQFDIDSDRDLLDPATNAEAAYDVFRRAGSSFQPWSTFGDHERFLDEARRAVRSLQRERKDGNGGKENGGDRDGFVVDPDALSDYARRARVIAEELASLRAGELRTVTALADGSFGRIGRETGFAAALERFGRALGHQVHGVGRNADTLARSVTKTAKHYQEQESDIAHYLLRLLRDE